MDAIPIAVLFIVSVVLVVVADEAGYRLGRRAHRHADSEMESPVSAVSAAILGLLAFILAFTFAIVSDRYDARKELVRDEANAIRTAYLRSQFLPEPDRAESAALLRDYVDARLTVAQAGTIDKIPALMAEADRVQRRLWDVAVANARQDMNSDVAALYVEALNEVTNVHWLRVAIGVQARIPSAIWFALLALVVLGMIGVGYQTAIAGSQRTWATLMLALAFSLVIALIAEVDRPQSGLIRVTQQPLEDLQVWMATEHDRP